MGFEPLDPRSKLASVNDFVDRMSKGLEKTKSALSKAKDKYTLYYNHHREPAPELQLGDLVWVDTTDIATDRLSVKLAQSRRLHQMSLRMLCSGPTRTIADSAWMRKSSGESR